VTPSSSTASDEVRLAIVVRDHAKYSETFVRRHITHLFGGRTVVISIRGEAEASSGRPTLICGPAPWGKRVMRRSRPLDYLKAAWKRREQKRRILEFLKATRATHVLCEFGYVGAEVMESVAASGLPFFCYFRGNDASAMLNNPDYVARLKVLFPKLDGVFAVSRFLLDNLARHGLIHPVTQVVPSGIDTESFRPGKTDPHLLLTVGRLVAKKSPVKVIEALALLDDLPHLRLEIIGEGPDLERCIHRARALSVADRIHFLGRQEHEVVRERMGRAAVYVQHFDTSPDGDTEGMPSVIQEAMAAGRAIVTTRHAGIPEHVTDGATGILTEPGDVHALAEGIRRLVTSPELCEMLGRNARQYAIANLEYRGLYQRVEETIARTGPRGRSAGGGR
jgi:colanic acid/amylovoran biosynthesis glycosyltransferase